MLIVSALLGALPFTVPFLGRGCDPSRDRSRRGCERARETVRTRERAGGRIQTNLPRELACAREAVWRTRAERRREKRPVSPIPLRVAEIGIFIISEKISETLSSAFRMEK